MLLRAFQASALTDSRVIIIDGERIRIHNIDAPETRGARCEAELVRGLKAKERLAQLLRAGPVTIDRCEASGRCEDRYGRTLARLRTGAGDAGGLVREGLAQPWRPGAEAAAQRLTAWCGRGLAD